MKQFLKYAAVGIAGYFIGWYEMKYKTMKLVLQEINSRYEESEDEKS